MNLFASASASLRPNPSKFLDFPGPKSLSRTFQVLEILQKNPELSSRRGNADLFLPPVYAASNAYGRVCLISNFTKPLYHVSAAKYSKVTQLVVFL